MLGIVGLSRLAGDSERCSTARSPRMTARLRRYSMILGVLVAACGTGAEDSGSVSTNVTANEDDPITAGLRGTVVTFLSRFDDGTGDQTYFLRNAKGDTQLFFEREPNLAPGTPIRVWGEPMKDGLRVGKFEFDSEPGVGLASSALINGMKYKARTFGLALVDIGAGINITKDEMTKRLFGVGATDKSVKQYYMETSYGTQDLGGEVVGPFMYPMSGKCDTTGMAKALKPMMGMYDHYLWYFGSRTTACQFSGLAEGGQPSRPTNDTWYNGSANCVVLVQEPGHNFGMMHSSSMTCTGMTAFADDPDSACTHNEYGDRYDPMGGACNHMNAWQKVFEGWLQKCNGLKVKSSGMYTLQPLELACDGPQVLQIPFPKVRPFGRSGGGGLATVENLGFYYLELRTPRGFDSTIRTSPTILVRVAEDYRDRMDRGRHTWLLDMEPTSTRTIEGLGMGKTFTDPAGGVSFTVMAISQDSATIQVTIPNGTGPALCLDDTPFDQAGASKLLCGGLVAADGTTAPGMPTGGMAGAAAPPPPKVEALILVDADTDKDIRPVQDMAVLDLSQLPPNLSMRVDTDPEVVGSVVFRIDAGAPRTENMAPYSITPHTGPNITPMMLALGAHTVNATAFDMPNGMGRPGEPLEIDFTLTRSAPVAPAAPDVTVGGRGAAGTPGVGVGARAGTSGLTAGTGTLTSPQLGAAGSAPFEVPTRGAVADEGCGCRVPGEGAGSTGSTRAWALAALAVVVFVRRRRRR